MSDITDLIENRLEERIAVGKERFDAIETNIDEALAEVKPLVQAELSKFGGDLTSYNNKFRAGISNLELPSPEPMPELANDVFQYIYYTGREIIIEHTPLLNGPSNKNRDQRSGILHIVRDP